MRVFMLIAILLLITANCFSQNQAAKTESEYIAFYRIDEPAVWMELNQHTAILPDYVYTTYSGFQIYSDVSYATIGGTEYILILYPNFKGKKSKDKNRLKVTPVPAVPKAGPINEDLEGQNGKWLCMKKADYLKLKITPLKGIRQNIKITGGQLTVPFKLRPKQGSNPFQMTTDVTVGAYAGIRYPLSKSRPHYLTVPFTAGLTFININDNTTTLTPPSSTDTKLVPGITWSTGVILQFDQVNLGFVFGKDYASQIVDEWLYHKKTWFSFAIGFSFLK